MNAFEFDFTKFHLCDDRLSRKSSQVIFQHPLRSSGYVSARFVITVILFHTASASEALQQMTVRCIVHFTVDKCSCVDDNVWLTVLKKQHKNQIKVLASVQRKRPQVPKLSISCVFSSETNKAGYTTNFPNIAKIIASMYSFLGPSNIGNFGKGERTFPALKTCSSCKAITRPW